MTGNTFLVRMCGLRLGQLVSYRTYERAIKEREPRAEYRVVRPDALLPAETARIGVVTHRLDTPGCITLCVYGPVEAHV